MRRPCPAPSASRWWRAARDRSRRPRRRRTRRAPKQRRRSRPDANAAEEEDDDDFWGDDEEQTEEEKAQAAKELEEAKAKAMAKLAKKEANQRSLCNLEIKPWEADQDLKALYAKDAKTVVKDGLKWSEGLKLVGVAFGVQKIMRHAVVNQTRDAWTRSIEDNAEDLGRGRVSPIDMA